MKKNRPKTKMTSERAKALIAEGESYRQEREGGDATYFRKRAMESYAQQAVLHSRQFGGKGGR